MGPLGNLEHHEHVLSLQMGIFPEDIVHVEASIYKFQEKVYRDSSALNHWLPTQNFGVRLYSHRAGTTSESAIRL